MASDVIMTNNIQGGYSATEHLIRHGFGKIAIIAGPLSISTGKDRMIGYKRALEDYGITELEELIKVGEFTTESGYNKMKELMNQKTKPEAVFISNNSMTLGAYKYLKDSQIAIPDEVAIFGYDDPDWADVVDPPISTVIPRTAAERCLQPTKRIKESSPTHWQEWANATRKSPSSSTAFYCLLEGN